MTLALAHAAPLEAPPIRQVVHGPITFVAHCDRDGLPFFGSAFVGYLPTGAHLGPSALRRMIRQAARHGESKLEATLASMLEVCIHPAGIALAVRTGHDCAGPRLIDDAGGRRTTSWRGRYRADRALRSEFLALYAQNSA